jgi:hypothetical protein
MADQTPDRRKSGWIGEIPGRTGQWLRMPNEIRYRYGGAASCQCPICLDDAAGNAWGGWFSCDIKGCCIALVDTGEVFVRVNQPPTPTMQDDKPSTQTTDIQAVSSCETVPSVWLAAALRLLYAMAEEGIEMEGCADPALLMMEIASYLGVADADDPWDAAIQKMQH